MCVLASVVAPSLAGSAWESPVESMIDFKVLICKLLVLSYPFTRKQRFLFKMLSEFYSLMLHALKLTSWCLKNR